MPESIEFNGFSRRVNFELTDEEKGKFNCFPLPEHPENLLRPLKGDYMDGQGDFWFVHPLPKFKSIEQIEEKLVLLLKKTMDATIQQGSMQKDSVQKSDLLPKWFVFNDSFDIDSFSILFTIIFQYEFDCTTDLIWTTLDEIFFGFELPTGYNIPKTSASIGVGGIVVDSYPNMNPYLFLLSGLTANYTHSTNGKSLLAKKIRPSIRESEKQMENVGPQTMRFDPKIVTEMVIGDVNDRTPRVYRKTPRVYELRQAENGENGVATWAPVEERIVDGTIVKSNIVQGSEIDFPTNKGTTPKPTNGGKPNNKGTPTARIRGADDTRMLSLPTPTRKRKRDSLESMAHGEIANSCAPDSSVQGIGVLGEITPKFGDSAHASRIIGSVGVVSSPGLRFPLKTQFLHSAGCNSVISAPSGFTQYTDNVLDRGFISNLLGDDLEFAETQNELLKELKFVVMEKSLERMVQIVEFSIQVGKFQASTSFADIVINKNSITSMLNFVKRNVILVLSDVEDCVDLFQYGTNVRRDRMANKKESFKKMDGPIAKNNQSFEESKNQPGVESWALSIKKFWELLIHQNMTQSKKGDSDMFIKMFLNLFMNYDKDDHRFGGSKQEMIRLNSENRKTITHDRKKETKENLYTRIILEQIETVNNEMSKVSKSVGDDLWIQFLATIHEKCSHPGFSLTLPVFTELARNFPVFVQNSTFILQEILTGTVDTGMKIDILLGCLAIVLGSGNDQSVRQSASKQLQSKNYVNLSEDDQDPLFGRAIQTSGLKDLPRNLPRNTLFLAELSPASDIFSSDKEFEGHDNDSLPKYRRVFADLPFVARSGCGKRRFEVSDIPVMKKKRRVGSSGSGSKPTFSKKLDDDFKAIQTGGIQHLDHVANDVVSSTNPNVDSSNNGNPMSGRKESAQPTTVKQFMKHLIGSIDAILQVLEDQNADQNSSSNRELRLVILKLLEKSIEPASDESSSLERPKDLLGKVSTALIDTLKSSHCEHTFCLCYRLMERGSAVSNEVESTVDAICHVFETVNDKAELKPLRNMILEMFREKCLTNQISSAKTVRVFDEDDDQDDFLNGDMETGNRITDQEDFSIRKRHNPMIQLLLNRCVMVMLRLALKEDSDLGFPFIPMAPRVGTPKQIMNQNTSFAFRIFEKIVLDVSSPLSNLSNSPENQLAPENRESFKSIIDRLKYLVNICETYDDLMAIQANVRELISNYTYEPDADRSFYKNKIYFELINLLKSDAYSVDSIYRPETPNSSQSDCKNIYILHAARAEVFPDEILYVYKRMSGNFNERLKGEKASADPTTIAKHTTVLHTVLKTKLHEREKTIKEMVNYIHDSTRFGNKRSNGYSHNSVNNNESLNDAMRCEEFQEDREIEELMQKSRKTAKRARVSSRGGFFLLSHKDNHQNHFENVMESQEEKYHRIQKELLKNTESIRDLWDILIAWLLPRFWDANQKFLNTSLHSSDSTIQSELQFNNSNLPSILENIIRVAMEGKIDEIDQGKVLLSNNILTSDGDCEIQHRIPDSISDNPKLKLTTIVEETNDDLDQDGPNAAIRDMIRRLAFEEPTQNQHSNENLTDTIHSLQLLVDFSFDFARCNTCTNVIKQFLVCENIEVVSLRPALPASHSNDNSVEKRVESQNPVIRSNPIRNRTIADRNARINQIEREIECILIDATNPINSTSSTSAALNGASSAGSTTLKDTYKAGVTLELDCLINEMITLQSNCEEMEAFAENADASQKEGDHDDIENRSVHRNLLAQIFIPALQPDYLWTSILELILKQVIEAKLNLTRAKFLTFLIGHLDFHFRSFADLLAEEKRRENAVRQEREDTAMKIRKERNRMNLVIEKLWKEIAGANKALSQDPGANLQHTLPLPQASFAQNSQTPLQTPRNLDMFCVETPVGSPGRMLARHGSDSTGYNGDDELGGQTKMTSPTSSKNLPAGLPCRKQSGRDTRGSFPGRSFLSRFEKLESSVEKNNRKEEKLLMRSGVMRTGIKGDNNHSELEEKTLFQETILATQNQFATITRQSILQRSVSKFVEEVKTAKHKMEDLASRGILWGGANANPFPANIDSSYSILSNTAVLNYFEEPCRSEEQRHTMSNSLLLPSISSIKLTTIVSKKGKVGMGLLRGVTNISDGAESGAPVSDESSFIFTGKSCYNKHELLSKLVVAFPYHCFHQGYDANLRRHALLGFMKNSLTKSTGNKQEALDMEIVKNDHTNIDIVLIGLMDLLIRDSRNGVNHLTGPKNGIRKGKNHKANIVGNSGVFDESGSSLSDSGLNESGCGIPISEQSVSTNSVKDTIDDLMCTRLSDGFSSIRSSGEVKQQQAGGNSHHGRHHLPLSTELLPLYTQLVSSHILKPSYDLIAAFVDYNTSDSRILIKKLLSLSTRQSQEKVAKMFVEVVGRLKAFNWTNNLLSDFPFCRNPYFLPAKLTSPLQFFCEICKEHVLLKTREEIVQSLLTITGSNKQKICESIGMDVLDNAGNPVQTADFSENAFRVILYNPENTFLALAYLLEERLFESFYVGFTEIEILNGVSKDTLRLLEQKLQGLQLTDTELSFKLYACVRKIQEMGC